MKELPNINSLFSKDGKNVGKCFYICDRGTWKCFDATISNIESILQGKHPFFERKSFSDDEIEYLNRGLSLLKNKEKAASEKRTESEESLVQ